MKTLLPICIAVLFLFAPGFHHIQRLAPPKNAPSVPFHTSAFPESKTLPKYITGTVTIGPNDGVIVLHTEVTVAEGASLVLQPGTTIAVAEYAGIRVLGNVQAIGTTTNPITFMTSELNETNRNWNGILFEPTSTGHIEHAIFHHASPAISCSVPGKITLQANTYLFGNLDIYGSC